MAFGAASPASSSASICASTSTFSPGAKLTYEPCHPCHSERCHPERCHSNAVILSAVILSAVILSAVEERRTKDERRKDKEPVLLCVEVAIEPCHPEPASCHPELACPEPFDVAQDRLRRREGWEEMLDALDAVSPLIDDVRPGLAFLEMHGIAGDVRAWMMQVRRVLAGFGSLRLGAGSNKIAARAAAYVADGSICEPGSECELLALLPLTLLDIEAEVVERLALLGIERLGDLAALPHGPFVRRFGMAAARWHELARGIDRRPFVPRSRAVAIEASIFGEGRAVDEAQVFFALRMLLARVCVDLERCGKRAGALHLALELEDAQTCTFDVPLAMPTAHERTMFDMMRTKLEGATFESAIVGLRVQA